MNRTTWISFIILAATLILADPGYGVVETIEIKSLSIPPEIQMVAKMPATQPTIVISVDSAHPGQPIDGIGGAFNELGQDALTALDENRRQQVLRSLFDPVTGANLSFNRIPIGASDFAKSAYSLDDTPGDWDLKHFSLDRDEHCLIPYIQSAQKFNPAMRFHASPWSPPGWLKTGGSMAGRKTSLIDTDQAYKTYGQYFVKFLQGYAADGIHITRLCPQNESLVGGDYPGCIIPPDQYGKLTKDWIVPAIAESGLKTEVWAGTFNVYVAKLVPYFKAIQANTELLHAVKGVSFQYTNIHLVEEFHSKYPDIPLQFSESRCHNGANTIDEARLDFQDAVAYFRTGVGLFTYWNMVLPEPHKSTWGWQQDSLVLIDKTSKAVTYNPSYSVAKFLGHHIIQGARYLPSHIETGSDIAGSLRFDRGHEGLDFVKDEQSDGNQILAFKEPDNSVVIYILNQGRQTTVVIKLPDKTVTEVLPADALCAIIIK